MILNNLTFSLKIDFPVCFYYFKGVGTKKINKFTILIFGIYLIFKIKE